MRHFFYDTETGGRTPEQSLLTLSGVVTDEQFNKISEIDLKIKPADGIYRVSPEALQINGIDLVDHHAKALSMEEATAEFQKFLLEATNFRKEKLHPAGWKVYWDNAFVKSQLLPEFEDFFSASCLDVASVAVLLKSMGRLPSNLEISLGSLAKYFCIDFLSRAHDAKSDVWMTISVLKCLQEDLKLQKL